MIARHWRGTAKASEADNYIRHLTEGTFLQLAEIPGFVAASVLRRDRDDGVEFLVITEWESMEAIRRFAGDDIGIAVVPAAAQAMLVVFDRHADHFEVVARRGGGR